MSFIKLIAIVSLLNVASIAHAQQPSSADMDVAAARALFERGVELSDEQRWGEAAEEFRRSLALAERPGTLFSYGVACMHVARPVDARRALERFVALATQPRFAEQRTQARQMIEETRRTQSLLSLDVSPADARVTIDGLVVSSEQRSALALNPGEHTALVQADGYEPVHAAFSLGRSERMNRQVSLTPRPTVVPAPQQVAAATENNDHIDLRADEERDSAGFFSKPVVWIVAGAVVVVAVVSTVLIARSNDPAIDAGNTGWTGMGLARF